LEHRGTDAEVAASVHRVVSMQDLAPAWRASAEVVEAVCETSPHGLAELVQTSREISLRTRCEASFGGARDGLDGDGDLRGGFRLRSSAGSQALSEHVSRDAPGGTE
jgi:hypothetical protein